MNDKLRLFLGLFIANVLSVLCGFHLVNWTPEQIGLVNGLVDSGLLLGMYLWPQGQGVR